MRQIKRTIYDDGHPSNHFEIGSLETLEKVDRQVLLDFHNPRFLENHLFKLLFKLISGGFSPKCKFFFGLIATIYK